MFKNKKQFSLIELLCVIAVAAILMALVLPAFFNMIKEQSVEMAAREIGSKLKSVRTYAISQRQYTALVFITSQTTTNNDRYCYKSYRPCIVSSSNVFQSWVPNEKWDLLPTGTIIRSISISLSPSVGTFESGTSNTVTSIIDTNVLPSISSLPAIIFKPTGEIEGNRVYVTAGEGFFKSGSALSSTTKNATDNAMITVDQFTGRISYGNQ
jgi:prepilin-type N-terminal cleavage/methylation domain-containing protein